MPASSLFDSSLEPHPILDLLPLEALPFVEPLGPLMTLEGYTHESFMEERNFAGWAGYQRTRPLRLADCSCPSPHEAIVEHLHAEDCPRGQQEQAVADRFRRAGVAPPPELAGYGPAAASRPRRKRRG